jgi:phosphoadenosine phosphosulfate reductase
MTVIPLNQSAFATHAVTNDVFTALSVHAESMNTHAFLQHAIHEAFPGKIAIISSFAAESVVLLHPVAQIDPTIPVLFLNTHKLFGETMRYRDRVQDVLGLTDVRAIGPHPDERKARDPEGTLWSRDPDACCHFRKMIPMRRALSGFDAFVTGRKRFQTSQRATMQKVETAEGRIRLNPLVDWTLAELMAYIDEHRLPKHPLISDGYPSIGCIPCTRRVGVGEGYREGRWAGHKKDECGIHTGLDGEGI